MQAYLRLLGHLCNLGEAQCLVPQFLSLKVELGDIPGLRGSDSVLCNPSQNKNEEKEEKEKEDKRAG